MSYDPHQLPDDPDVTLPPRLLADLTAIQRTPAVPPAVDAAIIARAREQFSRQRRIHVWRWTVGSIAAAVILGLGLWITIPHHGNRRLSEFDANAPQAQAAVPFSPEDIDHNGTVDVLDAFKVARGIKAHQTQPAWDINHDGVVDEQDVDLIAKHAVRVTGGVQ